MAPLELYGKRSYHSDDHHSSQLPSPNLYLHLSYHSRFVQLHDARYESRN
ncbi:unnamed protein product [Penicillium roqueforti FM164]|uniref:Genomic scaffold, ProqFM164S02 n=1 Tax=Penicillium roqueforti (strain FM164) TaxID=1365484 RepID=W6Q2E0_PENRF|nr:unnamed protein product [Penicillium roqueforti FM164]